MNILHVYKTFLADNFGGVEQLIAQIARNPQTPTLRHRIVSLSSNPHPKKLQYFGCENIRYKEHLNIASNSISFSLFKDFNQMVQDADVIHYHFPWPFADILHLFWQIKKPTVITYHSDIVRQKSLLYFYRPIMNRFLASMNHIVATSPNYLATSNVLQQFQHKVKVIPIGLDKASYVEPSAEKMAYWQSRFKTPFFLFVGVMRYYKGLHILLDAAKNTSLPIVIVGTGPIEEELKAHAEQLKLTQVHFLGRLEEEDKIALLQLCLALVFPSHLRSEAFGISLLEGAMYGKPLISAEIGTGTSYINIHQETGLVIPPDNAEALRQAMYTLWNNPQTAQTMGNKALARYWQLFTAENMVREYELLYHSLNTAIPNTN